MGARDKISSFCQKNNIATHDGCGHVSIHLKVEALTVSVVYMSIAGKKIYSYEGGDPADHMAWWGEGEE